MKKTLTYPGFEVKPGTKVQKEVVVPGTDVVVPVTIINGAGEGKRVVVTSGIHSGEYVGIQCAIELGKEIDPKDVNGEIIFVHPCNPTGFFSQISYFVPEDGKNLGHCFPGDPEGTLGERIGNMLTTYFIDDCDLNLDLHGGDLHERLSTFVFAPKDGDEVARAYSMELSKHMNCKYIVLTGGGLTKYCTNRGIASIVLERGDRGLWNETEVAYYKRDVINALKFSKVLDGDINFAGPKPYIFEKVHMKYAPVSGCWYRFIELDEHFEEGQKLGEIRDWFGNILHTVVAEYDGVCHSYWTALAIHEGQLMVGFGA